MSEDPGEIDGAAREALEDALGYRFEDVSLLVLALTHSSLANDRGDHVHNERLEFLGDSVIGLVVAQLLYEAHPGWREGELTRGMHALVDRSALARLARELDLGSHLRLGRTERRSDGHTKDSILADAMEAVIGAVYLDGGLEPLLRFARRAFAASLADGVVPAPPDPKTALQEWLMAHERELPVYLLTEDSEVDGDPLRFSIEVRVEGEVLGRGAARSKRLAERAAAAEAIATLESGVSNE